MQFSGRSSLVRYSLRTVRRVELFISVQVSAGSNDDDACLLVDRWNSVSI